MSGPDEDKGLGNLFKIIDGLVEQMHRTRRMFIVMILTVMILPPVALFVASVYLEPPFGGGYGGGGPGRPHPPGVNPQDPLFSFVKQLPLFISIVWLGVGIYQWTVLSKWTKRYDRYKERQRRAEEKLGDSNDDKSEQNGS
jgi:hypothetical protein